MRFLGIGNGYKIGGTLALGVGVVLLAPVVIPVLVSVLRPVAKAAIKGSIMAYEKVKLVAAETVEGIEDLAAEAKAELEHTAEEPAPKPQKAAPAKAKA